MVKRRKEGPSRWVAQRRRDWLRGRVRRRSGWMARRSRGESGRRSRGIAIKVGCTMLLCSIANRILAKLKVSTSVVRKFKWRFRCFDLNVHTPSYVLPVQFSGVQCNQMHPNLIFPFGEAQCNCILSADAKMFQIYFNVRTSDYSSMKRHLAFLKARRFPDAFQ